jgi:hypothetical protein
MTFPVALAIVIGLTVSALIIALIICARYPPVQMLAPPDDGLRFERKSLWVCRRCGMSLDEAYDPLAVRCLLEGSLPDGTPCPMERQDIVVAVSMESSTS